MSVSSTHTDSLPPRTKCEHVIDDSDDENVFEGHISKAQKISMSAGCPKAGDYESSTREVILSAANTYCALLVSQGAFPTSLEELELVKCAWKRVNVDREMNPMGLTLDIVRVVSFFLSFLAHTLKIKAHGSPTHGKTKAKTAALIETLYGFDSRQTKKAITENHRKAEELKSKKGFVFEVCVFIYNFICFFTQLDISCQVLSDSDGKQKGIYKHPIIQKAVNTMWFKNK